MKIRSLSASSSRRGFLKTASAAAAAVSSFSIIGSPHLCCSASGSQPQVSSQQTKPSAPRLNCAETVLSRACELYSMDLTPENMTFASAFGGGMGIGDKCGTVTGSLMVIGYLFKDTTGKSSHVKKVSSEFLKAFSSRMASLDCVDLKNTHRTESEGCNPVISAAMEILETTVTEHSSKRIR